MVQDCTSFTWQHWIIWFNFLFLLLGSYSLWFLNFFWSWVFFEIGARGKGGNQMNYVNKITSNFLNWMGEERYTGRKVCEKVDTNYKNNVIHKYIKVFKPTQLLPDNQAHLAHWLRICRCKYYCYARCVTGQPLPIKQGSKLKASRR